jgi:hypothetical protein
MMTWAALVKAVLDLLNSLFSNINNRKHETLGRLQEAQRNAEADNALVDALRAGVDRADPDSVRDDEITR